MPLFGKKKKEEKKEEHFQSQSSSNLSTSVTGNHNGTVFEKTFNDQKWSRRSCPRGPALASKNTGCSSRRHLWRVLKCTSTRALKKTLASWHQTRTSSTHMQQTCLRTVSMIEKTTFERITPATSSLRSLRDSRAAEDGVSFMRPSLMASPLSNSYFPRKSESAPKVYEPVYTKNGSGQYISTIKNTFPVKVSTDAKVCQSPSYAKTSLYAPIASATTSSTSTSRNADEKPFKVTVIKTGRKHDVGNLIVPTYQTSSKKHGKVLILNNIKFIKDSHERHGAKQDEKNLTSLFQQMGFGVMAKRDLKKNDLLKAAKDFANSSSWRTMGICVVVVMSHGTKLDGSTNIVCTDSLLVPTDDILDLFTAEKCSYLHGVPKIFIFQCCRGNQTDTATGGTRKVQTDAAIHHGPRNYADMLIAHATVPGYVAHRDPENGSWYIQTLCEVFAQNAHNLDVESMLKIVDKKLSQFQSDSRQTSSYESRGFNRCYFHP